MVEGDALAETEIPLPELTVTCTVATSVHPPALPTVTVYVVVTVGLAVVLAVVVLLSPVAGDQE
jgi:hypothetical protein